MVRRHEPLLRLLELDGRRLDLSSINLALADLLDEPRAGGSHQLQRLHVATLGNRHWGVRVADGISLNVKVRGAPSARPS